MNDPFLEVVQDKINGHVGPWMMRGVVARTLPEIQRRFSKIAFEAFEKVAGNQFVYDVEFVGEVAQKEIVDNENDPNYWNNLGTDISPYDTPTYRDLIVEIIALLLCVHAICDYAFGIRGRDTVEHVIRRAREYIDGGLKW
jgi:hypothetical protein